MASKFTLTVFAADGVKVESTKEYSRKIDAENAGRKTDAAWTVANPKGEIVSEGAPKAAPAAKPAPKAATPKEKVAKALDTKAGKRNPTTGRKVQYGTFNVTSDDMTSKCVGACGEKKPAKAFPTITGRPGVRVAECRTCRDTRTKAEKAAKAGA